MAMPAVTPISAPRRRAAVNISGVLLIPAPGARKVELRYRSLEDRDTIDPLHPNQSWSPLTALKPHPTLLGHFHVDVNTLGLPDGSYEYEYVMDGNESTPIPDPFADEIIKFGGYRSVFRIVNGKRVTQPFSWDDELPQGVRLASNNQTVIYEMPVHWMSVADQVRQVGLGTFEKIVFEHLEDLHNLGINAIELLPVQDSADTLNWGYGTRFFFAPDWDMGSAIDMKFFVKCCHRNGIRAILDVVMNHSRECPLEVLAKDWFYLRDDEEPWRNGWGGARFRYANPVDGKFHAREFHYRMAEFWIREYHIDGFRLDEFNGINNWDFLQGFREHAWAEHKLLFSERPFLVIAEDSGRRAEVTHQDAYNDKPVVDSAWNFDFRDELRRLLSNNLITNWGQPARRNRIENMVTGHQLWNDWDQQYRPHGFTDLAQAVNYITSHDVEAQIEQRLMSSFLADLLARNPADPAETITERVKRAVDNITSQPAEVQAAHADALERTGSAFALMLTSVGIPMFLAGEEFGDIHDLEHSDWRLKMSDPVDFTRRDILGHRGTLKRVQELIALRTHHPALQRSDVQFFYHHPTIDENDGVKAFAYCRTNGQALGNANQVIVLANCCPQNFPVFDFPWFWDDSSGLQEHGTPAGAMSPQISNRSGPLVLSLSLAPFQVRVFST